MRLRHLRRGFVVVALGITVWGCGEGEREPSALSPAEAPATHVHGLGINPADDALFVATHSGLFRAGAGEELATRVGDRRQDTMGFTVSGPDEFLGSGHPDLRDELPPLLGLISSGDAGRSWMPVSLLGEADFHVLRTAGTRLYGLDSQTGLLMVSADGGRTWAKRTPPGALIDVAPDPRRPERLVASAEDGIFASGDDGSTWRPLTGEHTGLLVRTGTKLLLVDGKGMVYEASDDGARWTPVGEIDGRPAALAADGADVYVALHSNEVKVSRDGGASWQLRARVQ